MGRRWWRGSRGRGGGEVLVGFQGHAELLGVGALGRGEQEARSAAMIRHPNAVTLYDVLPATAADEAVVGLGGHSLKLAGALFILIFGWLVDCYEEPRTLVR